MTREDIIKLAREAGIVVTGEAVWRLCELVAAAEREACAKVCEDKGFTDYSGNWFAHAIRARGQE